MLFLARCTSLSSGVISITWPRDKGLGFRFKGSGVRVLGLGSGCPEDWTWRQSLVWFRKGFRGLKKGRTKDTHMMY